MTLRQRDIHAFFRGSSGPSARSSQPRRSSPPPSSIVVDDSDDEIVCLSSPAPKSATRPRRTPHPSSTLSSRAQPRAGPTSLNSRPQPRRGSKMKRYSDDEEPQSDGEIEDVRLSSERQVWRPTGRRVVVDEDEEDEEGAHVASPAPVIRAKRKASVSSNDHDASGAAKPIRTELMVPTAPESEAESVAPPESKPPLRRNGMMTRSRGKAPAHGSSPHPVSCDASESDSKPTVRKGETPIQRRIRRVRAARLHQPLSSSDEQMADSDSFIASDHAERTPRRRRSSAAKGKGSAKRARIDPDEESDARAGTEDEAASAIELDEPERFKTATRLRQKGESEHQRLLRKLKNKRLNLPSSLSASEAEDEDGQEGEEESEVASGSEASFITSDDDGFDERLMPSEFSLGYAQSQEYKFKVVFQYLLLLVIHGPGVLPLRGQQREDIAAPSAQLRSHVREIRNLRVRSQIWRADFVKALETFPDFGWENRDEKATYCHACNRRNQHCWQTAYLSGKPYDRESHITEMNDDHDDDEDGEDDEEGEAEEEERLPRVFDMGPHCLDSSRLYHSLSHWEHKLYDRVRGLYRDLLRAKDIDVSDDEDGNDDDDDGQASDASVEELGFRSATPQRVHDLRGTRLPDHEDVNAVLEWMEEQKYQNAAFEEFAELERAARRLGGDDAFREIGAELE